MLQFRRSGLPKLRSVVLRYPSLTDLAGVDGPTYCRMLAGSEHYPPGLVRWVHSGRSNLLDIGREESHFCESRRITGLIYSAILRVHCFRGMGIRHEFCGVPIATGVSDSVPFHQGPLTSAVHQTSCSLNQSTELANVLNETV